MVVHLIGGVAEFARVTEGAEAQHEVRARRGLLHVAEDAVGAGGAEAALVRRALRLAVIGVDVPVEALGVGALAKLRKISTLGDEAVKVLVEVQTVFAIDAGASQPMPAHLLVDALGRRLNVPVGALGAQMARARLIILADHPALLLALDRRRVLLLWEGCLEGKLHAGAVVLETQHVDAVASAVKSVISIRVLLVQPLYCIGQARLRVSCTFNRRSVLPHEILILYTRRLKRRQFWKRALSASYIST